MGRRNLTSFGRIVFFTGLCCSVSLLATPLLSQQGQPQDAQPSVDPAFGYSTYLGGSAYDYGYAIAIDPFGNTYIAGQTNSPNFPTTGASIGPGGGTCDGSPCLHVFVAKLNGNGSSLIYATIIGGNNEDHATGIAVDSTGAAYVTGYTASTDFPTLGAFQPTSAGGNCGSSSEPVPCYHAFVAKLDPSGSQLVYSTYLGGSGNDFGAGIAVDSSGAAYVTGSNVIGRFSRHSNRSPESLWRRRVQRVCHQAGSRRIECALFHLSRRGARRSRRCNRRRCLRRGVHCGIHEFERLPDTESVPSNSRRRHLRFHPVLRRVHRQARRRRLGDGLFHLLRRQRRRLCIRNSSGPPGQRILYRTHNLD